MANETPAQVRTDDQDGAPAPVEAWQDEHGNTNLPDNPAYAAPPASPADEQALTGRARQDQRPDQRQDQKVYDARK